MAKNIILVIVSTFLLIGTSSVPAQQPATEQTDDYVLVFSDEFNLPNGSQPDDTKWSRAERNKSDWAKWISNSDKVVYIKNGKLVCRAIPNTTEKTDTATMLTGAVWTKHKYAFTHGKVEVRMKTNVHQGNFPAAWMSRAYKDGESVPYGEIDIVEMFGTNKKAYHNIHSQYTLDNPKHGLKKEFIENVDVTRWHVYGIEWTPTYVRWTIDGEVVGTYYKSSNKELLAKHQWTFDAPYFIKLNQSVGCGHHGLKPERNRIYETQFDWIRIYQKKKKK